MTAPPRSDAVSPTRRPSDRLVAGAVVLALASATLTACSNPGGTTCGEFADQDTATQRETMKAIIENSNTERVKGELARADSQDDYLDQWRNTMTVYCDENGDADAKIGDLIYAPEG